MAYRREYYVGGGSGWSSGVGRIYVGNPYQQGSGIGSFFGGIYRFVLPLVKSGAKTVGKEALSTGINIVSDIASNKDPREALRMRLRESARNLKRKADEKFENFMSGEGYKAKRRALSTHFPDSIRATSTVQRKKRKLKNKSKKKTHCFKKENCKNKKTKKETDRD